MSASENQPLLSTVYPQAKDGRRSTVPSSSQVSSSPGVGPEQRLANYQSVHRDEHLLDPGHPLGSYQNNFQIHIDNGSPRSSSLSQKFRPVLEDDFLNSEFDPLEVISDVDFSSRRQSIAEEDVCFPAPHTNERIDFNALEEYINDEVQTRRQIEEADKFLMGPENLSTSKDSGTGSPGSRLRYERRRRTFSIGGGIPSGLLYGKPFTYDQSARHEPFRFTLYSTVLPNTIHAHTLSEIPSRTESLSDMLKAGDFWLNIFDPSDDEMRIISKIFHIHPLTTEDILAEEARDKCEVFHNYYFICFRSFDRDPHSPTYLSPLSFYTIVFKGGIISIHFKPTNHAQIVRRRIKQLKGYIAVTPDWINYALLDDITDSFAPLIHSIELEVDSIDELVLILKESEQSDMLRRIGHCRKKVMGMLRLLQNKADVIKTLLKRSDRGWDFGGGPRDENEGRGSLAAEVALYLGDVQDHILTMVQSLNHYEKISSRSHSNYLAQISIEMTKTNNGINDVLTKLTALGSVLIPMSLITGLWGMNVQVPGQDEDDLTWFFGITSGIVAFIIITMTFLKVWKVI